MLRLLILLLRINWLNFRPADCLPNACFCEAIGNGLVRQPVNAYTNVAYLIVGICIFSFTKKSGQEYADSSQFTLIPRHWLIIFGLAFMAVSFGSFVYHASFIFLGEEMDDDSMYLVGLFILLFQISRKQQLSKNQFIFLYVFFNVICEIAIYFFPEIRGGLFALIILASVVVELLLRKRSEDRITQNTIIKANLIFVFAYAVWILDKTHILCNPHSLFQGHAVWHVISAYAGWLMFKAMDSEYENFGLIITNKGRIKSW